MIDHRARQTGDALRESRLLLEEGRTFEQAKIAAKEKRFPVGSVWHWSTGNVWAPIGSAAKDGRNAA